MKRVTARETRNLADWLRTQGMDDDKITECLEAAANGKGIPVTRTADG